MPERVRFTIDGRPAEAEAGTSVLAALWNAGLWTARTSVSGEARGPLCGMGTCFECRVTIDGGAHRRSCLEPVREGLEVVRHRPVVPMTLPLPGPEGSSGITDRSSPDATAAPRNDRCLSAEVVVVGGGPAGIAAAVHAAEAGARTLLLDEQARPGGQIWRGEPPLAARAWLDRLERAGAATAFGATVVDNPGPGRLLAASGARPLHVAFERLVLATGARELFLPFPGWTLPGVLGAGGAQALLKGGGRFDGLRVVVAGSGPLLLAVAAALRRAGARIVGVAEQAPLSRLTTFGAGLVRQPGRIVEGLGHAAALLGVPYRVGAWVCEAEGRDAVGRALLTDGVREWAWDCDVLACSFGLVPNLELPRLLGCETTAHGVAVDVRQRTSVAGVFAAGELGGIAGVGHALATGALAGLAAAGLPVPWSLSWRRARERRFAGWLARAFSLRAELLALARPHTIVCRCEDVPLGRIATAGSSREAKLHTRAGMGDCQGRVCGPALAVLRGWEEGTVRPPLEPVPLSVLEEDP